MRSTASIFILSSLPFPTSLMWFHSSVVHSYSTSSTWYLNHSVSHTPCQIVLRSYARIFSTESWINFLLLTLPVPDLPTSLLTQKLSQPSVSDHDFCFCEFFTLSQGCLVFLNNCSTSNRDFYIEYLFKLLSDPSVHCHPLPAWLKFLLPCAAPTVYCIWVHTHYPIIPNMAALIVNSPTNPKCRLKPNYPIEAADTSFPSPQKLYLIITGQGDLGKSIGLRCQVTQTTVPSSERFTTFWTQALTIDWLWRSYRA